MEQTFYSNGKLLITAEYVVLDGALALALPTKFGQDLVVNTGNGKVLEWTSFDKDGSIWFKEKIDFSEITNFTLTEIDSVRNTLISVLHQAFLLNPVFINQSDGYVVSTHLTFEKSWGLGTSSTLINNIAQWAQIDAFALLKNSFGGSGYDIACAQNNTPILYQLTDGKPAVEKIDFKPDFSEQLYFVYLNKKQNSRAAITSYRNNKNRPESFIVEINRLTEMTVNAIDSTEMAMALEKHEKILSGILGLNPVQQELFSDFDGTVKSLGAWGGDFILVISKDDPTAYFISKGYDTVLPYEKIIL